LDTSKIHISSNPDRIIDTAFADELREQIGSCPIEESQVIVAVGGDGSVLYALKKAQRSRRQSVIGVRPPKSNSHAYLCFDSIVSADELILTLANKKVSTTLEPLRAKIKFANGIEKTYFAFNDISIVRTTHHACYLDLKVIENGVNSEKRRIKGDGLIISTAIGSTGINYSYGGPKIAQTSQSIIMNGMGVYDPPRTNCFTRTGFPAKTLAHDTQISVEVPFGARKYGKTIGRPVRVDYDTGSIEADLDSSEIIRVDVSLSSEESIPFYCKPQSPLIAWWK